MYLNFLDSLYLFSVVHPVFFGGIIGFFVYWGIDLIFKYYEDRK